MKYPTPTKRATTVIASLMAQHAPQRTGSAQVPIMCWFDSIEPSLWAEPSLAFDDPANVPPECITETHGMQVAFYLPDAERQRYRDHVLDFLDDSFVFLPSGVIALPEQA